jgi:hypothetical protein
MYVDSQSNTSFYCIQRIFKRYLKDYDNCMFRLYILRRKSDNLKMAYKGNPKYVTVMVF